MCSRRRCSQPVRLSATNALSRALIPTFHVALVGATGGDKTPKFFRPPVNFEQVGQLESDLIVNVQSQGKQDEYATLSGIATTLGLPKGAKPNQVPWRQSTEVISRAVGVYTTNDTRMQVVTAMGLKPSPFVETLGTDDYFVDVSPETLGEADTDVVIVLSQQSLPMTGTFAQYPQIARMAANAEQWMVYPEDANIGLALSRPRC